MLIRRELSLSELHILLVKVSDDGKGATDPSLAKPAMANYAYDRMPTDAVTDGTTYATSFMRLSHLNPPKRLANDMTANVALSRALQRVGCSSGLCRSLKMIFP